MRGSLIIASSLAALSVPVVTAGATTTPVPPPNSIGIKLVDQTANSHARSYIIDRAAPGTRIRRRVEITNTTASTATVTVYPAAASVLRGTFGFAPAHRGNELSSWTSIGRRILRVPSGATAFTTVTIAIPRKASLGERYAVVWAEVSAQIPVNGGVTLVNRVGVRMYVSVGQGGAPPTKFVIGPLSARRSVDGEPFIVASVRNSGLGRLEIRGTLSLSHGPGGLRAGPFPVELGSPLVPGDSETASVRLDTRLPLGPWRARLRLRSGSAHRAAAATITFPPFAVDTTSPHSGYAIIVGIALLVLLLAVAASIRATRARAPA